MIPDVEAAVVGYLSTHSGIVAITGANGVSTELPPGATLPHVRVTLTGGGVAVERWLYSPRLTFEAWANDKAIAFQLAATVLDAVESDLPAAQVIQGVITGVAADSGLLWSPDPDTQTPRYVSSATVYIHPNS